MRANARVGRPGGIVFSLDTNGRYAERVRDDRGMVARKTAIAISMIADAVQKAAAAIRDCAAAAELSADGEAVGSVFIDVTIDTQCKF